MENILCVYYYNLLILQDANNPYRLCLDPQDA